MEESKVKVCDLDNGGSELEKSEKSGSRGWQDTGLSLETAGNHRGQATEAQVSDFCG